MYPPVSLGSALKIAAAARRLNSSSSHGRRSAALSRAKSALPRVNLPDDQGQSLNGGLAPSPGVLKRSNSVTGVFIDAPPPRDGTRPGSATVTVGRSTPTPGSGVNGVERSKDGNASTASMNSRAVDSRQSGSRLQVGGIGGAGRPESSGLRTSPNQLQQNSNSSSSMDSQQSKRSGSVAVADSQQQKRPGSHSNIRGQGHGQADSTRSMRNSASTSHSRAHTSHSHAPFSSHVATEREAREREENGGGERLGQNVTTPRSPYTGFPDRNSSFLGFNDDTVDDLGEDLFAERRAELLEEEQYRAAAIAKRKDRFLKDIDLYLREHPPLRALPVTSKASPQDQATGDKSQGESEGEGVHSGLLFRRRRVEFDDSPTYLPESDYRERLMGLWRDMNKCRYLRVPDEMIDLSGINTLATDTMKLLQVIKHRDIESLPTAWVE